MLNRIKPLNPDASKEEIINRLNEITEYFNKKAETELERLMQENKRLQEQMFIDKEIRKFIEGI